MTEATTNSQRATERVDAFLDAWQGKFPDNNRVAAIYGVGDQVVSELLLSDVRLILGLAAHGPARASFQRKQFDAVLGRWSEANERQRQSIDRLLEQLRAKS